MITQTIILNTEQRPVKERHIAFYACEKDLEDITIGEVVEAFYPHPDTNEILISRLEMRSGKTEKKTSSSASPIQLVLLADKNMLEVKSRYFYESV